MHYLRSLHCPQVHHAPASPGGAEADAVWPESEAHVGAIGLALEPLQRPLGLPLELPLGVGLGLPLDVGLEVGLGLDDELGPHPAL